MPGMDWDVLFELVGALFAESRGDARRDEEGLPPVRGFEGVVIGAQ